jgi:hypothetical protein
MLCRAVRALTPGSLCEVRTRQYCEKGPADLDCATWLHKAREMPRKRLTGKSRGNEMRCKLITLGDVRWLY